MNTRTQLVVSPDLADAARRRAPGLADSDGLAVLARYAMARLAGWPHSAALDAAKRGRGRPPQVEAGQ